MTSNRRQNFCSIVTRKQTIFKRRIRAAISKRAHNPWERVILRNEILFYTTFLPIYNTLNQLHFSGRKICPTFFKGSADKELLIQDLKNYQTKDIISLSEARLVINQLSIFHAIGFLIKNFTQHKKSSQRIRGNQKWCTFIHGDCWSGNFMFCGEKRVKLIDFGFFGYDHCLKDIVYLIFTSTRIQNLTSITNYYKDCLQSNLRKINLEFDTSDFEIELRKIAKRVYPLTKHVIQHIKSGADKRQQLAYIEFAFKKLTWRHPRE